MKRAGKSLKAMAAPVVRLNVGGVAFDVSRSTLEHCEYFDAYLHGRMQYASDSEGRIFIDRNGDTFAVLLDCMRKKQRPAQKFIDSIKKDLLDECEYFGLRWLTQKIKGEISPLDLRPFDCLIYTNELAGQRDLLDVFRSDIARKEETTLQLPLLFRSDDNRDIAKDYECFHSRLDARSNGLLARLPRVPELMVAGGAVIGALTNAEVGDFDIFLKTSASSERLLRQIIAAIQQCHEERYGRGSKLLITRSRWAVTVYRSSIGRPGMSATPIQIVTTTYASAEDLLAGFDVDCCCFAWLPEQARVLCSARGLRALQYRVNIADNRFAKGYCRRLEKYAMRGFAIAIPGLDWDQINPNVFKGHHAMLQDCDLLVRKSRATTWNAINKDDATATSTCRITFQHTQIGRVVKDVERLLVLDAARRGLLQIERLAPVTAYCERHKRLILQNGHEAIGPVMLGNSAVSLVSKVTTEDACDFDFGGYSIAPTVMAQKLLLDIFKQEQIALGEETFKEDAFWRGGSMERLTKEMRNRCTEHLRVCLEQTVRDCLWKRVPVPFVFDLVFCHEAAFDSLRFVRDAGRPPFTATTPTHFKNKYGLDQKLSFTQADEQEGRPSIDWFSAVYR